MSLSQSSSTDSTNPVVKPSASVQNVPYMFCIFLAMPPLDQISLHMQLCVCKIQSLINRDIEINDTGVKRHFQIIFSVHLFFSFYQCFRYYHMTLYRVHIVQFDFYITICHILYRNMICNNFRNILFSCIHYKNNAFFQTLRCIINRNIR